MKEGCGANDLYTVTPRVDMHGDDRYWFMEWLYVRFLRVAKWLYTTTSIKICGAVLSFIQEQFKWDTSS